MRAGTAIIVMLFSMTAVPTFAEQTDEQCKTAVEITIEAMRVEAERTGIKQKQKLKDLTIEEIKEIQKTRGNCAAAQEIKKRTRDK